MSAKWERDMFRVVPFQFEAVALSCFGNGGADLVCDPFLDEFESAVIGSHRVHGQFLAGVGEQYRSDARNYHNRLGIGERYLFEPVEPVPYNVYPQG